MKPSKFKITQFSELAQSAVANGVPADEIFTPIMKSTGKRKLMRVAKEHRDSITRGPGDKGIIRDQLTGKRYRITGHPCSLPTCFCDAMAEEVSE